CCMVNIWKGRYHADVGVFSSRSEHSWTDAGEEEGRMRLLKRLRVKYCSFGTIEFSFEVDLFLGPEFQNKVQSFAGLIDSDLVRIPFTVSLKFCLGPARSHT